MEIKVKYIDVCKINLKAVEQAIKKLRKSKCKERNSDPSKMKWIIRWCQKMENFSLKEILNNIKSNKRKKQIFDYETGEEFFESVKKDIYASICVCPINYSYHSETLTEIPEKIKEYYIDTWKKERTNHLRFESLSEKEQKNEFKDVLKQLVGHPGFIDISLNK